MDGTHVPNNKLTCETMSKRGGKVEDQYYWPHRVCTRCGHATPPTDKRREGGRNGDAGAHDARHTPEQSRRQVSR